jgi:hypothetical protein
MSTSEFKENFRILQISRIFLSVLLFTFIILPGFNTLNAQGNLLITPRRVVFEGNKRVAELNLVNTGSDTSRYNVSVVQYRMTENGAFQEITEPDPGQLFADKNLRFFPRSVTLAPNEAQTIKMQVFNLDKLSPGEYRSHVYFRAVPRQIALGETDTKKDSNAVSVQIVPIFGITIPVIIRIGNLNVNVSISDIKLTDVNGSRVLGLTINRTGSMSVYGDLKITYITPEGKESLVGAINGIAVYTPNAFRQMSIELNDKTDVDLKRGKLRITFSSQSDTKPEKFAEAELKLE